MKTNRGKSFEKNVRDALSNQGYFVLRLQDSMGGFAGVNNPCDFIAYKNPIMLMIECKAIHGKTLNFKSHIRPNQENGMYKAFIGNKGIYAGFLIWYIDYDKIKFYSVHELVEAKANGECSFSVMDSQFGFEVLSHKLRVNLIPCFTRGDFESSFITADIHKNKSTGWI